MFKQILRFAKSTLQTPKYERQPDPRQKNKSLIQKHVETDCINASDIRKRMYFEKQCVKYCQLMKKIIPKHFIYSQENLHIRHFSNKGYPWNMFCRKQKALHPNKESIALNPIEEEKLLKNTDRQQEDCKKEMLQQEQDCKEDTKSNTHYCSVKGNTYAAIIKEISKKKIRDITEHLLESSGKSKTNNECYGISYTQTKFCVAVNDNANTDILHVSRSNRSDLINQKLDNFIAMKCDISNLCKNTTIIKPSNRTYTLSPCKQIFDGDNKREAHSHCGGGRKKEICDDSDQCESGNRGKNPCGEPPSMKRSQMLAKKFISCSKLKASFKNECKNKRRKSSGDDDCPNRSNPCGESKSQVNVKKFVSCSEMKSGCAKTSKRAKPRSKPCIAQACDVSTLQDDCSKPTKKDDCEDVCPKKKSSKGSRRRGKICIAKRCDPSSGKYKTCSVGKKKRRKKVISCKSKKKKRRTCRKSRSKKARRRSNSKCEGKKSSSSCKLPDFGTPSKMNKYTIGGSGSSDVNIDRPKSSECKSSPRLKPPSKKKCVKRKKSSKPSVKCTEALSASKSKKMCTKATPTSKIVKKKRKKSACVKKQKEFKFKVKKSTIATCKINRKLRRRMKKRVIEVKYPWNTVPNHSQCLFETLAIKDKKSKEEAAKKEARELASKPTKCNYTIKTKKRKKKRTTRYRAVRTCQAAPKQKPVTLAKMPKNTILEDRMNKAFPWNTVICDSPKCPSRPKDTTIPRRPSLKTLRKLARQNQNCLRKMKLLARCKEAQPILDCNKDECDYKHFSTRSSECGDEDSDDVDDGCKCLYCGTDIECKVCPGTCKAPQNHMKDVDKDILCSLCHIFHTRGSPAISKYFKEFYKNKEYHLFTDAAFLDLQIFLRGSRLPQPKSRKNKPQK